MSFTTTATDNIITIGDTDDTVKLNKISPLYTSVPTFSIDNIGGFINGVDLSQNVGYYGSTSICKFENVPPGNYIIFFCSIISGYNGSEYGFNLNCSETIRDSTTPQYNFTTYGGYVQVPLIIPYNKQTAGNTTIYITMYSAERIIGDNRYSYLMRIS
jgi:hypothetical protein